MFVRIRLRWKPPAQFAAFHRIRTSTGKRHFCRAALGRLRRLRLPNPGGTENHAILGPSLLAQLYVRGGFLGLLLNQTRGGAGSDGLACHSLFSLDQYLQQCQVSYSICHRADETPSKLLLLSCVCAKKLCDVFTIVATRRSRYVYEMCTQRRRRAMSKVMLGLQKLAATASLLYRLIF